MARVYYCLDGKTYQVECDAHQVSATVEDLRGQGLHVYGHRRFWIGNGYMNGIPGPVAANVAAGELRKREGR